MSKRLLLTILMIIVLLLPQAVIGHGGEEDGSSSEPLSLSLETILLITILVGIVSLYVLFAVIGIEDRELLLKMAAVTMILLVIDYTYFRFFR